MGRLRAHDVASLLRRRVAQLARREGSLPASRARARDTCPEGGFVLAANHTSNFDPWPLGIPFLPERQLRFMAKAELFNPMLAPILRAGGAFKVRRGEGDVEAMRTAVELAREGEIVVMFPEGTRRTKGLRKKREARPHTGAARIALTAGVPLVPAAIAGTDRLAGSGRCASPTATPIDVSDLDGLETKRAATIATERLMAAIERAEGDAVKPLLVDRRRLARAPRLPRAAEVDPRCNGALVGFANMLAAALGGRAAARGARRLGHARGADLPARGVRAATRAGRVFEDVAARAARPAAGARRGVRASRTRRRAATRPTTSSAPRSPFEEARGGDGARRDLRPRRCSSSRASGRRSCSRCAASRELARIGPAEVRERYGVEPAQVPDFIALRGDPSDKLPGAARRRAEEGRRRAARSTARSRPRSRPAASPPRRRILRLYRRIATRGRLRPAPSPRRPDTRRGRRRPLSRSELGPERARRAAGEVAAEPIGARQPPRRSRELHPTGAAPRVAGARLRRAAATRFERRSRASAAPRGATSSAATTPRATLDRLDAARSTCRRCSTPTRSRSETSYEAALLAAGCAIEAVDARRLRARAAARPPRAARPRDGLLPLRQRRGRRPLRAGRARARARRDRRLGRPPRQRHAGRSSGTTRRALRLAAPVAVLSRHRRARRGERDDRERAAAGRLGRRGLPARLRRASSSRPCARSSPSSCSSRPASTPTSDDPLAGMRVTADGFRELARRSAALAPRVAAVLEGGYNPRRCRRSSGPRSKASRE